VTRWLLTRALPCLLTWCALELAGGRAATRVLAGEIGGVQGALGLCYGVAWLAAVILGPMWLLATLIRFALERLAGRPSGPASRRAGAGSRRRAASCR
jgi:hypothetical protein